MKTLTLKLHGPEPETLPVGSLAKYLSQLAKLYGDGESMHLDSVSDGCACVNIAIEDDDYGKALSRIKEAHAGQGAKQYRDAYRRIIKQIDLDGYQADFYAGDSKVVSLPSKRKKANDQLLTQVMPTSVKGRLYSVGGKDDSIPVRLEAMDKKIVYGETAPEIAKRLGADLFQYIHAHGRGEWVEQAKGGWSLRKLVIDSYEVIENVDAKTVFDRLRKLGGLKEPEGKGIHTDILESRG